MCDVSLSLPSTVIYYLRKSSPIKIKVKISQTSKLIFNLVRKAHGYSINFLSIIPRCPSKPVVQYYKKESIEAKLEMRNILKLKNIISVKSGIKFYEMRREKFVTLLKKIDLSKFNGNITFRECDINLENLKYFCETSVEKFNLSDRNVFHFDELCYSLEHAKHLKNIDLLQLKSRKQIVHCIIKKIPRLIDPKLIGTFAKNIMARDGKFELHFMNVDITTEYKNACVREAEKENVKLCITSSTAGEIDFSFFEDGNNDENTDLEMDLDVDINVIGEDGEFLELY